MGVKPIIDVSINLEFLISKIDKIKFCNINGGPGIIRKIIKYSNEEFEIYLSILLEYFKKIEGTNFFKKKLANNLNPKLPKTNPNKDIANPKYKPKKYPVEAIKITFPGMDSAL